jgi:uncharacterized membrane protein
MYFMVKVMNVVFGIGIAVLIFIVVLLGIQTFYPRPEIEDFGCDYDRPTYIEKEEAQNQTAVKEYEKCFDEYDAARDVYDKNFFLITSIIGFVAVIVSMFLLSMTNIAAGTAFSGLGLIVFGFMIGWQSTNDILKFIIGLVIAVVVIIFAVKINKKYSK